MKNIMSLINRRDFLVGISGFTISSMLACSDEKSQGDAKQNQKMEDYDLQLRPHHILDIISDHGQNIQYEPHPYGHSLHLIAPKLLLNLDLKIKLVLHADDNCTGGKHLLPDGKCKDVLSQIIPSPSKQAYNDVLDSRLFDFLSIKINSIITVRNYLKIVNEKVPGIEKICTHPKKDQEVRLKG